MESSQRVDRVGTRSMDSHAVGCMIPRTNRWVTSRCRLLHGCEALQFQGINFADSVLENYSTSFLTDMAGNAFHSGCAAIASLAVFATLGVASQHHAYTLSAAVCMEGEPDDLDDLLSLS